MILVVTVALFITTSSCTLNPASPNEEVKEFEGIEVYWNREEISLWDHVMLQLRVKPWLHRQDIHIFSNVKAGPLNGMLGTHKEWSYIFEAREFCTKLKEKFSRYEIHCNTYIPIDPIHPDGPI